MADVFLKQKRFGCYYLGDDNIVEVVFIKDNFEFVSDTVHFSGETGHSVKIIDFEPIAVLLDPFEKTNDATIDNYRFFNEPKDYHFPGTYFKIYIENLTDSVLIQATHNFVAPDSLKAPVNGLRISPNRYWKIDGVLAEDFHAQGRFNYNAVTSLDNELILSENDSLILLYRDFSQNYWHYVPQDRVGRWNTGYVYIEDLKLGEYATAVWDKHAGIAPVHQINKKVKFYPNPARNKLNIEFVKRGKYTIRFYNEKGVLMKTIVVNGKKKIWRWDPSDKVTGILIAEVFEDGQQITSERILIIK